MKNLYLLSLSILMGTSLLAQKRTTLQWRVVNEKNEPLEYVVVNNKKMDKFAVTDAKGEFSIEVEEEQDALQIAYIGYETTIIPIKSGMKTKGTVILFPGDIWCCITVVPIDRNAEAKAESKPTFDGELKEPILQSKVHIFPNPTSSTIFLQQEVPIGLIDLYNLNEQKLQSFNFKNQLNASINLSIWPAGTYLLRSSAGWVEKVILQKE